MTLPEILGELERLNEYCQKDEDESFNFKKRYNHVKNSILDILESSGKDYKRSSELMDDDDFEIKEKQTPAEEQKKQPEKLTLDLEDLI